MKLSEAQPCSAYVREGHTCRNGFFKLTGICWHGDGTVPPCMDEKWQGALEQRFESAGVTAPWHPGRAAIAGAQK